jgi:hypothetical protein
LRVPSELNVHGRNLADDALRPKDLDPGLAEDAIGDQFNPSSSFPRTDQMFLAVAMFPTLG